VTTSNPAYAEKIRSLRDWGQDRKYHHVLHGYNYRLEAIQGAMLRVKLRHLETWTEARRRIVEKYGDLLADADVVLPVEMEWARHVYHLFTVRTKNRDATQAALLNQGIQTGVHYATPVHLQPAYQDLGYGLGSLPESEKAAKEVLSLPMYPELTDAQLEMVAEALTACARRAEPAK
jgi:dTDP-4-amino-4,6-dideoxygalactose transaminase